jgi:proline iminopeptidase
MGRRNSALALALTVVLGCSESPPNEAGGREEGVVAIEDGELRWIAEGAGPVLLVVGSTDLYPAMFSENLREHFRLVFLDGRHFARGYSPEGEALEALTLEDWVDDVEVARTELGLGEITILGHSIHGQIALRYAEKYPESLRRLILVGPVAFFGPERDEAIAAFWDEVANEDRKATLEERQMVLDSILPTVPRPRRFAVQYAHEAPLYWADPHYDPSPLLGELETTPAWGRLTRTVPDRSTLEERLQSIDVPTLLVLGRLDFSIPHPLWEDLIEGIGTIEYELMTEDSHNPQTENAEDFDAILVRFAGDS